MKKVIILFIVSLIPLTGISQSLFQEFEDRENVGTVTISKGMFNLVASMMEGDGDPEAKEVAEMAKNLDGLQVFMTEDKLASADMLKSVKKYLKSTKMEELMRVKDNDTHVKIYIKNGRKDNHVTELLMFVTGLSDSKLNVDEHKFETVLLSLRGDIDLAQIGALTDKMDLPKDLKRANKNK